MASRRVSSVSRKAVYLGVGLAMVAVLGAFALATTVSPITGSGQNFYYGTVGNVPGVAEPTVAMVTSGAASYSASPIAIDTANVAACATASGCVAGDVGEQVTFSYTTQATQQTFTVVVTVQGSGGGPWSGSTLTFHDDGSQTAPQSTVVITVDLGAPANQIVSGVTIVMTTVA